FPRMERAGVHASRGGDSRGATIHVGGDERASSAAGIGACRAGRWRWRTSRLSAAASAFMLQHGEAKVLLVDREFSDLAAKALAMIDRRPLVTDVHDPLYDGEGERRGAVEY